MYLFHEEVLLHEIPNPISIVSVVRVDVELQGMEVTTEKEKTFRKFDVVLLQ